MPEIQRQRHEIDVSVQDLLAQFHEQTPSKLAIAPVDSITLLHSANGITEIDKDGWCTDYDDTTAEDAITVESVAVVDTILTTHHHDEHTNQKEGHRNGPQ